MIYNTIKLKEVLRELLKDHERVFISSQSESVIEELKNKNSYCSTKTTHPSYVYIEDFYGFKPIFAFEITRENIEEGLESCICNIPCREDTSVLILRPDVESVRFIGEYYNWCDFRLALENEDFRVKYQDTFLEELIDYLSESDTTINDLGFPDGILELYNSKELFESSINQEPYNLPYRQVILDKIMNEQIIEAFYQKQESVLSWG